MAKLWGGRFQKSTDKKVDDFNSSIRFDKRMYKQDIKGSVAHATMLGKQNIIPKEDSDKIVAELKNILKDIEDGKVEFEIDAEDIHMNIEKILIERIGDAGKRLHTGRSRNDQVALDIRMYLMDETADIEEMLIHTLNVLVDLASDHTETIMPGYTHLQKAQPVTFAHHQWLTLKCSNATFQDFVIAENVLMLCLWAAVRLQVLPTLLTENLSQANLVLTRLQ